LLEHQQRIVRVHPVVLAGFARTRAHAAAALRAVP
jgi:hypothetical protein